MAHIPSSQERQAQALALLKLIPKKTASILRPAILKGDWEGTNRLFETAVKAENGKYRNALDKIRELSGFYGYMAAKCELPELPF